MKTFPEDDERDRMLDRWQEASAGWGRQADGVRDAAMAVSEWMLEHANLRPGTDVVELAAGPGDTGFLAAARIQPGGKLISSDAVQSMLEVAKERAQEQGVTNVEFKQLQLEWIDLPTASADAILIKWALMLVLDPAAALRECRRVLKPGGTLSLTVWDLPEHNPWTVFPQRVLNDLDLVEPAASTAPGMFALSEPGRLRDLLDESAFFDVVVEPIPFTRTYPNVNAWIGETIDLSSSFKTAWSNLSDDQRSAVRTRLTELAKPFTGADGAIALPATSLGASASA